MGILNKTQTNTPTMRTFALLAIAGVAASVKVFGPEAGEGKKNDAANEGKGGRDMPSDEEWQEFREVCTWIGDNIDHAAIEAGDYDAAWESIREKAEEHGVTQEEAGEIVMGCPLANEAGAFDPEPPPKEPTEEEWEEFVEACTWLHDNIDHDAMKNEDYDAAWESIREDAEAHGVTQEEAGELVMACIMADEHGLFDEEEDDAPEGEKPEGEKPEGEKPAEGDFAQEGDDEADDEESGDEKPAGEGKQGGKGGEGKQGGKGEGKGDDSASDDDDSASDDDDSDSDDDDFDSDSGDEWEKDSQDGEGKQGGKGGEGKQGGKDDDEEEEADEAKADEAEFAQKKGQRGGKDGEKDDEGSDSDDDDSDSDDGDSDSDDDFEKDGEKDGEDKPEGEGEGKPEGEGEGKPEGEGKKEAKAEDAATDAPEAEAAA